MPSIERSKMWFVRVTVPHEFAKSEMSKMLQWIDLDTILGALHEGDKSENPHFHAVIKLTSEIQKQSFDIRVKKIYGVKGNNQYSSKPWDGADGACSYLFHEDNAQIFANRGYSSEDIDRFKKLNDDVKKVVAINQSRASHRHVDKVIQTINASGREWTRIDILEEFIKRIRSGDMYEPGDFMLKRYIEEIMIKQLVEESQMTAYVHDRYYAIYKS